MDELSRLRYGALAIFGFAILLWIGVNAFAAGEAIGKRPFGWLVLVPVALWGLRIQMAGARTVLRASPDDPRWRRSSSDPS